MIENLSPADREDPARPARRGAGLALLALFLALTSLGWSGWLWWQDASEKQGEAHQFAAELSRQGQLLAKIDARSGALESQLSALVAKDPAQRLNTLEQDLGSQQQSTAVWKSLQNETAARIQSLQDEMESAQARLAATETRLTTLSARAIDSSAELDLAEVDYLLRLAQERLALFGDTRTADRALEIAGRHVAAFDNLMYIGLQHEIASARQKLSLLNLPDYQTLDQKLTLLQSGLGALAFKGERVTSEQPVRTEESGWWARFRNVFSGLVTVRRSSGDEKEFPVLADQELIRQKAWLELEMARWAAVRRDQEAYTAALNRFSETLERWFEPSDPGRQGGAEKLRELRLLNVDPPMPDISAPWTALRALQGSGVSAPSQHNPVPQAESPPESPAGAEAVEDPQTMDLNSGDAAQ